MVNRSTVSQVVAFLIPFWLNKQQTHYYCYNLNIYHAQGILFLVLHVFFIVLLLFHNQILHTIIYMEIPTI